ncbi:MAG: hypothetical protein JWL59_618 [Chthoniobacteraceae bacterium]|nr:hypothetical protein [Chthoniobacteraceae bacterium]
MRRIVFSILGLLLAVLLGAGWYAYEKGFTKKWRSYVAGEFRKRGVEVSLRQLALEPWRGFVARDVKVYDTRDRRRTVAVIDEVVLVINYANFFKSQPFIEALDLREARLALPLDSTNPRGPAVEVKNLSGRLLLPPKQLYLSRFEADLYGVRVSAMGRLVNPGEFKIKGSNGTRLAAAVAARLIKELKLVKFEAEAPHLALRFSGDLADAQKIFIEGKLSARRAHRDGYRLGNLELEGCLRDGVVELTHLSASDKKGGLTATGRWEVASGEASLRLRSSLDAKAIAIVMGMRSLVEEFSSDAAPLLDLSLSSTLGELPSLRATGHVALGHFAFRAARFEHLEADTSWDNGRWSIRDLRLEHRSGVVTGDVVQVPDDFRARLQSTMNPRAIAPMLPPRFAELVSQFDFIDAPSLGFELRGSKPAACSGTAQIKLARASFHNTAVESASATVRYEGQKVVIAPFEINRAEGTASGGVTYDWGLNEIHLDKIRCRLHPADVMTWCVPSFTDLVAAFRFLKQPPQLAIDGLIDLDHGKATSVTIAAEAPDGMEVAFWNKELIFAPISAKLILGDQRLKVSEISAGLLGGRLRGKAGISLLQGKPAHNMQLHFEELDFGALMKLYFKDESSKGRLDGSCDISGLGGEARFLHGHGDWKLHEGDLFSLPFLKPLAEILNETVPGVAEENVRKASVNFTFNDGVISASDFAVDASGFTMAGGGRLMFLEDQIDFNLRANARGIPGLLLSPDGSFFEYVASEKLSKPKWRLNVLPR